jgi:hypothetical protein
MTALTKKLNILGQSARLQAGAVRRRNLWHPSAGGNDGEWPWKVRVHQEHNRDCDCRFAGGYRRFSEASEVATLAEKSPRANPIQQTVALAKAGKHLALARR